MPYLFLVLSAIFGALKQYIIYYNYKTSWLPEWVFLWESNLLSTLDASHVYQGAWLMLFGLAFYLLDGMWWVWIVVLMVGYWQVYNLFYHVIFRRRAFWRWPIG